MLKKIVITVIFVIMAAILLVKGKELLDSRMEAAKDETTSLKEVLSISLVKTKNIQLQNKTPFLAQILSIKSINISTKLAGFVKKIFVQESQKVKKGDLLVSIDSFEIRSNIDALKTTLLAQKSDLAFAQSIYKRNKKLYNIGGLSKEQLTTSKVLLNLKYSTLENTKQKIKQLKHQLSYLEIRAPFDGVIDTVLMHKGDMSLTGKPILKMSNAGKKLLFTYNPAKSGLIKKSQKVFFKNKEVGNIKTIYTVAQNDMSSAEVRLNKKIDEPVGSWITIRVLVKEQEGCTLPNSTLLHKKDGVYVMLYSGGKFTPLKVDILMRDENTVLLSPCPKAPVAKASEVKLAELPSYGNIAIIGTK
ncbi:MAG: efflux RND transporter periplasmic adaptor subunit [Sulfurospirillum sp.]